MVLTFFFGGGEGISFCFGMFFVLGELSLSWLRTGCDDHGLGLRWRRWSRGACPFWDQAIFRLWVQK